MVCYSHRSGPVRVVYNDWLRAGGSGNRIPVGTRYSTSVQTSPGAYPASCTMGTGSFPGVKSGRGVTLTPHPLLVPWSRKSRALRLLSLWAGRSAQSLSALQGCMLPFTFTHIEENMFTVFGNSNNENGV